MKDFGGRNEIFIAHINPGEHRRVSDTGENDKKANFKQSGRNMNMKKKGSHVLLEGRDFGEFPCVTKGKASLVAQLVKNLPLMRETWV